MKLNKLVSTLNMEHEEWLENRRKGIGGSDAGSICGLNPYSSAIAVFQDKTQPLTEKPDNESMRQGRDLEEYVARRFMEETGKKVRKANAIFYKEEQPFMLANVDRLIVGENAGLECKTASAYSADKWKDGHIPESYEIQCHHYMAVTGADAWYIACVILGKEFVWHKIERDEEIIQMLISVESDFWNKNLQRYDEEPTAKEITASTLTAMIDYIYNLSDELRENMIIHVQDPQTVRLYSGLNKERKREYLFRSDAIVPCFRYGNYYGQEEFLIEMQANFEVTPDLETILKVAGNVEAKTTANYGDDGVTQKTTIKQGIASKADVLVPNPVTLTPYRTFLEVKQPSSEFVFRIKDNGGAPAFMLVEAEGGLWRAEAMQNIKEYLTKSLEDISDEKSKITIIA